MSKKSYTKLEQSKLKTREMQEDAEHLRQVDESGGPEYVKQFETDKQQKEKSIADDVKTFLEGEKRQKFTYREHLAKSGQTLLDDLDAADWQLNCIPTSTAPVRIHGKWFKGQDGIQFVAKSPQGKVFAKGIKTTYDPELDFRALTVMVTQVENTIDSVKGILLSDGDRTKTTKSGIYLP